MAAGEASLHGWRKIHSSRLNTSDQPRLGLAIRFMCGDAVRQPRPVVRDRVSLAAGQFTGDCWSWSRSRGQSMARRSGRSTRGAVTVEDQ